MNLLTISATMLIGIGFFLLPFTWGGSTIIIVIGLIFLLTNQVYKESSVKKKNRIAFIFYMIGVIFFTINSKHTILICSETTNKIFIITGQEKSPEINKWYQLTNTIVLNDQNTFYTSSSNAKINKTDFKLKTQTSNSYKPNGIGQYNGNCEYTNSIFTIYFDITKSDSDSIDNVRFENLKEMFCKSTN